MNPNHEIRSVCLSFVMTMMINVIIPALWDLQGPGIYLVHICLSLTIPFSHRLKYFFALFFFNFISTFVDSRALLILYMDRDLASCWWVFWAYIGLRVPNDANFVNFFFLYMYLKCIRYPIWYSYRIHTCKCNNPVLVSYHLCIICVDDDDECNNPSSMRPSRSGNILFSTFVWASPSQILFCLIFLSLLLLIPKLHLYYIWVWIWI